MVFVFSAFYSLSSIERIWITEPFVIMWELLDIANSNYDFKQDFNRLKRHISHWETLDIRIWMDTWYTNLNNNACFKSWIIYESRAPLYVVEKETFTPAPDRKSKTNKHSCYSKFCRKETGHTWLKFAQVCWDFWVPSLLNYSDIYWLRRLRKALSNLKLCTCRECFSPRNSLVSGHDPSSEDRSAGSWFR